MEYQDVLADFARRTLANLDLIEGLEQGQAARGVPASDRTLYPVTQLINSLLGLIVFPKEGYGDHIPEWSFQDLQERGWPVLVVSHPAPTCGANFRRGQEKRKRLCEGNHRPCQDLRELMRVLRNGVSHFNIEFISDPHSRELTSLLVSNRCTCCNRLTTTVRLTVPQIREVARRYATLMIEHTSIDRTARNRAPSVQPSAAADASQPTPEQSGSAARAQRR